MHFFSCVFLMKMWKILEKSTPLFIQFNQEDEIKIQITDFIHIWSTKFTNSDFLSCLKKSNILIEFGDDNKLLERGIKMFFEPEKLQSDIVIDDDKRAMTISLLMCIDGFKLKLKDCKLTKQNEEYYFQHVTQPLLKTVKDLRKSENILRNMLIDKDKEITKYKVQNVDILYSGKTDLFVEESHMNIHNVYETNFGQNDIPDGILEKVVKAPEEVCVKLEENIEEKQETQIIKSELKSNREDQLISNIREEQECIKVESVENADIHVAKRKKQRLNY